MAEYICVNGILRPITGIYNAKRVEYEIHVNNPIPFKNPVDEVLYTTDINRRLRVIQARAARNISRMEYPVWTWTETNERGNETQYIACEFFYPHLGSRLFVHHSSQNWFRGWSILKGDFSFAYDWDVSNVTTMYCAFKECKISTLKGVRNWNLINCTNIGECFSQAGDTLYANLSEAMTWKLTNKCISISSIFYLNHTLYEEEFDCGNWAIKVSSFYRDTTLTARFKYLDMSKWNLTGWTMTSTPFYYSSYYGYSMNKCKTPELPIPIPLVLPHKMYGEDGTEYTSIPANMDKSIMLYRINPTA